MIACTVVTAFALTASAGAQPAPADIAGDVRGGELYQRWCAVCHANDGTGTDAGPPLVEMSIALVDLSMRTGAMPLTDENQGVRERTFTDAEREAALAYMVEQFGLEGAVAEPGLGDPTRGQDLYTVHCAACHGATGEGGVAGGGTPVPLARGAAPIELAQATRAGPFTMPPFSAEQITDDELDDIVAFLDDAPTNSPLGVSDLNRPTAFAWALLLGALTLAACWWIAHRPVRVPDADLPGERRPEGSHQ